MNSDIAIGAGNNVIMVATQHITALLVLLELIVNYMYTALSMMMIASS